MSGRRCFASVLVLTVVAVLGVKLKPDADLDEFKPKESRDKTLLETMNEAIGMQMQRHTKKSTELEEKNATVSTKMDKLQKSMEGGAEAIMADLEANAIKRNRLRKKKARRQAEQQEKQVVEADETKQTMEREKAEEDKLEEGEEDTVKLPMSHAEAKALRRQARKEALLDIVQQQLEASRADEKQLESEIEIQEHALAPEVARISALEKRVSGKKLKHDLKKEIALIKSQLEQDSQIVQELKDKKATLSEKAEQLQLQKLLYSGVDNLESETEKAHAIKRNRLRKKKARRQAEQQEKHVAEADETKQAMEREKAEEDKLEEGEEDTVQETEFTDEESVQPPKTKMEIKQLKRDARKEAVQHQLDAMQQELEELRRDQNQLQVVRDTVKSDMHALEKVRSKVHTLQHEKRR